MCDRGSPARCASEYANVNIKISRVRVAIPDFTEPYYDVTLTLPTCNNAFVTDDVTAHVKDDVPARMSYIIERGNDEGVFAIDQSTGAITVANSSLIASSMTHTLRITATHGKRSAFTQLTIKIASIPEDVLEVFKESHYVASVQENLDKVHKFYLT